MSLELSMFVAEAVKHSTTDLHSPPLAQPHRRSESSGLRGAAMDIEVPGAWPYLGGAILILSCIVVSIAALVLESDPQIKQPSEYISF